MGLANKNRGGPFGCAKGNEQQAKSNSGYIAQHCLHALLDFKSSKSSPFRNNKHSRPAKLPPFAWPRAVRGLGNVSQTARRIATMVQLPSCWWFGLVAWWCFGVVSIYSLPKWTGQTSPNFYQAKEPRFRKHPHVCVSIYTFNVYIYTYILCARVCMRFKSIFLS